MKICFVGPANSAHIVKWCKWFLSKGHDIHVITFTPGEIPGVNVHFININVNAGGSDFGKIKYIFAGGKISQIVDAIEPDIVNVHYATSYGIAVALSKIKKYVLSVWGADIYDFPKKSFFHRTLLKYSLNKATHLFSTSKAMAEEASKYTDKSFEVTPFGVDVELFAPSKGNKKKNVDFSFGTVKGLSDKYGIADILKAASIFKDNNKDTIFQLRIAGKGPQEQEYKELAKTLNIDDKTIWLGFISQEQAAKEWADMDVAIIPSTLESESFGVSAVEAECCETPVIITDIPGLMEATKPGVTSMVVKKNDPDDIAAKLQCLYENQELRERMGTAGRQFAVANYELNTCFERIETLFKNYL